MPVKNVSKTSKFTIGPDLWGVISAARAWYGTADRDSCCLAENRLMAGEDHPVELENTRQRQMGLT